MDDFRFTVDDFDVDWLTSGRGWAWPATSTPTSATSEGDGDGEALRPAGQPPADDRRHRAVPDRARLRAGGHRARRRRQHRLRPARRRSCRRGRTCSASAWSRRRTPKPGQIGLEGFLYPTLRPDRGRRRRPTSTARTTTRCSRSTCTPATSTWTPVQSQSVYVLDKSQADAVPGKNGQPLRSTSRRRTVELPDGLGSVTFDDMYSWQRIQISQTPGKRIALAGRGARAARADGLAVHPLAPGVGARDRCRDGTLVEVAALDRSGGGDIRRRTGRLGRSPDAQEERAPMTDAAWGDAEPAGHRGRRRRLLPGPGRAPRRVVVAAAGRPLGRGRGRSRSAPRPGEPAARADVDEHRVRVALFGRLGLLLTGSPRPSTCSPWWPRDERGPQPGARGATCTSSRSRARSWSPRSTSC